MKHLSLFACAALFLGLTACEEVGPKIDFGAGVQQGEDTTYTEATVETAQQKKVLAEEFTGVSCPPCPTANALMRSIKSNNNDNIVIVAYHIFNYPQGAPVEKDGVELSKYDFRTQDGTDVGNSIFGGISAMPTASFDRSPVSSQLLINSPDWSSAAENRLKVETPVNIHVTSSFDETTRDATVLVRLAYTKDVSIKQNLNVVVIEDSVVDAQKDGLNIVKEYTHVHILRDVVTAINGAAIPTKVDPKVAGRVYERRFTIPISEEWKEKKCYVVVYVTNDDGTDKSVVHVEEAHIVAE